MHPLTGEMVGRPYKVPEGKDKVLGWDLTILAEPLDGAILMSFVVVVITISIYQAHKTENALAALRDLSSPRALVVRGSRQQRIAGRDVVRGDLVVLGEGDRVPADAVLLDRVNLSVDESTLTGESIPVRKTPANDAARDGMGRPAGEMTPWVFSGTLVVKGHGVALVQATGARTELGRIGSALRDIQTERTLGSATAICVDKTGTLTMNTMTVRALVVDGSVHLLDGSPIPEQSIASSSTPCSRHRSTRSTPWTAPLRDLGDTYLSAPEHLHSGWPLVREYPLSENLLALSHVWASPDLTDYVIAAKGAPEAIADLCHRDDRARAELTEQVEVATVDGLRSGSRSASARTAPSSGSSSARERSWCCSSPSPRSAMRSASDR